MSAPPRRPRSAGLLVACFLLSTTIGALCARGFLFPAPGAELAPPSARRLVAAPATPPGFFVDDADDDDAAAAARCASCVTCKGLPAPAVCADGVPDAAAPDPGGAWDPARARAWFAGLQCPLARSMWVVSTLTPGHPREAHVVDAMRRLTAASSWGVLFVSTLQGDSAGSAVPEFTVLGRNVAVLNVSLAALRAAPLESARAAAKLLRARGGGLLTREGRLHGSLKLLPYLVALKCGVTAIFDTVDDELPHFLPGLARVNPDMVAGPFDRARRAYYALPPLVPEPPLDDVATWPVLLTPRADVAPVVNPYASLGNRALHPRGFPSEWAYNASFQVLHIQRAMEPVRPWVQQWVPHGHPDLSFTDQAGLRTHVLPKLMKEAPNIVLDQWAWAQFNGRGTLFLPGAFWALFLSPAQPHHFADTLRAYWAQRLLWDVGGTVSFRSTTSADPPPEACGSNFSFHQERLDGHCEGRFLLRDVVGSRARRVRLLGEELAFQAAVAPLLTYLDGWRYEAAPPGDAPQLAGLPAFFRKAQTLMCNLGESSQLANCRDCYALRAWLRDLVAAGYTPPDDVGAKPKGQDVFPLQYPSRENLVLDETSPRQQFYAHKMAEMYATARPDDRTRSLAVCLSGLADRIDTRLEPEDYSLPPYKRPKVREDLLLDFNLRSLAPAFGGMAQMHHFYVMGSFNTVESNLHLILQQRLPFVAIVVHRDWVLEPLLPPDEQCRMERYNGTWVQLKWTNEARHYQRSQLHQVSCLLVGAASGRLTSNDSACRSSVTSRAPTPPHCHNFLPSIPHAQVWEEAKCFELATHFMRRYNLRYQSFMRHRSDFNITLTPFQNHHLLKQAAESPEWKDSVYIPRGKDYRVSGGRDEGWVFFSSAPVIALTPHRCRLHAPSPTARDAGHQRPPRGGRLERHGDVHVPVVRPARQAVGGGPRRLQPHLGRAVPQLHAP
jgi:hypothetical protein